MYSNILSVLSLAELGIGNVMVPSALEKTCVVKQIEEYSFIIERSIRKKMFLNKVVKDDFYRQFISFKKQLRESKQSPMFKVFYELYFLAPKSMEMLFEINKNKRWNNKLAR